jgi:tetratricopeptide (TPR) repeat protein
VLVLLTVRDDRLGERPAEARVLAEIAGLDSASTLEVRPLAEEEHRALIGERLGLERRLVEDVLARAGGNPLFSLQVIGDWIARGLLVDGEGGFRLRDGVDAGLPDDLHALWQQRLARLLDERFGGSHEARVALELAAAQGLDVDPRAWSRACALAGVTPPEGLASLLIGEHLAVATRAGWAWVHGMLRESVEHMAEAAGRHAAHHRIHAEVLRDLHGEHAQGHAEEVARHLVAAGDLAAALEPLLDATYQMQLSGQYERAERVLGEHAALADRLSLAPDDVRRLRGRMQTVWLTWMRGGEGTLTQARARCREIAAAARRGGHDDVLGESLRWHGLVARFERRWDESLAALEQAAACFARVGDPEGQARTALAHAVTLRALGRLDEAEAALASAERLATGSELFVLLPRIHGNWAEIALQRGDLAAAEARFARAIAAAEDSGDRKAQALTFGGAGDLALARGRFAEADDHYRRAEALLVSLGSRYVHAQRVRRATVELLRAGGKDVAASLRDTVGRPDRDPLIRAEAHLGLALAAARGQDWAEVDAQVTAGEALLAAVGESRPVIVQLLEAVAGAVASGGEAGRADRLRGLMDAQAGRLDATPG